MIWVVVAVDIDECLLGHTEKTRRLPRRHATLRQPCRAGMPEGVRDDIVAKTGVSAHRPEGLVDALYWRAVPFDHRTKAQPLRFQRRR